VIAILLFLLLECTAFAAELQVTEVGIPMNFSNEIDFDGELDDLRQEAIEASSTVFDEALKRSAVLLLIAVAFGIATGLCSDGSPSVRWIEAAGSVAIAGVMLNGATSYFYLAKDCIDALQTFEISILPALLAAMVTSGAPSTAIGFGCVTAAEILSALISKFLVPLSVVYAVLITADAATGNKGIGEITELIRDLIGMTLKILLGALIGYMTVKGLIAGSADALALKTAKAASGGIPVIGGIAADAAESLIAGAKVIRTTIGTFGLIGTLTICVSPFAVLGINYLCLKVTAAFCGMVGGDKIGGLVGAFGGFFSLLLAMTAAMGILVALSFILSMITMGG